MWSNADRFFEAGKNHELRQQVGSNVRQSVIDLVKIFLTHDSSIS